MRRTQTVTLNGLDEVGKATQLRLLASAVKAVTNAGTVSSWDPRWAAVSAAHFSEWWFHTSHEGELEDLLSSSHRSRSQSSGPIRLEDRGRPMLVATAAATRSVRFGIDHATALDHAEGAIAKTEHDRTAIHVLIRRGRDIAAQVNNVIERHPGADQKYIEYQVALASIVALQLADGQYAEVIDADDQSIREAQEQLRGALTRRQIRCADLGLQSVQQIILMAGLSESGKSRSEEHTSELQSRFDIVCRLLLEKQKYK